MNLYKLKINKKNVKIELSSKSGVLIANEYNLFLAQLFQVNLEDVIKEHKVAKEKVTRKKEKTIESEKAIVSELKTNENTVQLQPKLPENFAQMLSQKTNEESNVIEKKTSELKNTYLQMQKLIMDKQLKNEIDYIIAASYCLTYYENLTHFTEKQIIAKITPFFENEISHDFILDALAKNYIKLLPDFTGTSDISEYSLTDKGEEYFLKNL